MQMNDLPENHLYGQIGRIRGSWLECLKPSDKWEKQAFTADVASPVRRKKIRIPQVSS